jgi:RNA polymerase sigma-70 factor (ECF subfamily)
VADDETHMARVERMVLEHQARLRAHIFARTGNPEVTDEIAQDVFLVALRRMDEFDESRPAYPWLKGIARNELREHWRRQARDSRIHRLEASLAARWMDREESTQAAEPVRSRLEALQVCTDRLSSRARSLIRMVYDEGLNCAQVAERLRRGAGAVRMAIHRVRMALRACVESKLKEATR